MKLEMAPSMGVREPDGQLDGEPGQQTRPAERRSASLMFSRVTLSAAQRSLQLNPGR